MYSTEFKNSNFPGWEPGSQPKSGDHLLTSEDSRKHKQEGVFPAFYLQNCIVLAATRPVFLFQIPSWGLFSSYAFLFLCFDIIPIDVSGFLCGTVSLCIGL